MVVVFEKTVKLVFVSEELCYANCVSKIDMIIQYQLIYSRFSEKVVQGYFFRVGYDKRNC